MTSQTQNRLIGTPEAYRHSKRDYEDLLQRLIQQDSSYIHLELITSILQYKLSSTSPYALGRQLNNDLELPSALELQVIGIKQLTACKERVRVLTCITG